MKEDGEIANSCASRSAKLNLREHPSEQNPFCVEEQAWRLREGREDRFVADFTRMLGHSTDGQELSVLDLQGQSRQSRSRID